MHIKIYSPNSTYWPNIHRQWSSFVLFCQKFFLCTPLLLGFICFVLQIYSLNFISPDEAPIHANDGKCDFDCNIPFKCIIIYARLIRGDTCISSKEAKAKAVIFIQSKAEKFHFNHVLILEVFGGIEENDDWILRSYSAKILNLSKCFAFIRF